MWWLRCGTKFPMYVTIPMKLASCCLSMGGVISVIPCIFFGQRCMPSALYFAPKNETLGHLTFSALKILLFFCIVKLLNWVHGFKKSGKFQCIWYGLYNGMWATNIQLAFCTTSNVDTFKVTIQVTNCYIPYFLYIFQKKK